MDQREEWRKTRTKEEVEDEEEEKKKEGGSLVWSAVAEWPEWRRTSTHSLQMLWT